MASRILWLVVGGCLVGTAHADHTSLHATATADVSATDNVFASTRDNAEFDVFTTLRPGLLFAWDAPRMAQELNAELEVLEFARHGSDQPSLSFRGGWRSTYSPGPRTQVVTQINGQTGVLSAISAREPADQAITQVQLGSNRLVNVDTADANEFVSYEVSPELRVSQTAFARYGRTNDNDVNPGDMDHPPTLDPTITNTYDIGLVLALERSFGSNALQFEAGADLAIFNRDAPQRIDDLMNPLTESRRDRQIGPRARLALRHDFNRRWSGQVDGGLSIILPLAAQDETAKANADFFPVYGAAVSFSEVWGRVTLAARRDIAPNLFIAQNTVNEDATLTLALPLPILDDSRMRDPKLVALMSAGFARTQLIDKMSSSTKLSSEFKNAHLDIGVGYTPRPGFTYGLRYDLLFQSSDAQAATLVPGFTRNTVSFTFTMQYPTRIGGEQLRRQKGYRADRKDEMPIGYEQVVPEAPSEGGGGESGGGGTAGGDEGGGADEE